MMTMMMMDDNDTDNEEEVMMSRSCGNTIYMGYDASTGPPC